MDPSYVAGRLVRVRERIAAACARAGRPATDVRLLAVSKQVDLELVAAAARAGQTDFGENRLQEALPRQDALAAILRHAGGDPAAIRWHFIGHLQANKVNKAAGAFALLHGVDSLELAQRLDRRAGQLGARQAILLEVNAAEESQKHGLAPGEVVATAVAVAALAHLDLRGLMAMARFGASEPELRATFARVRELRDRAAAATGLALPELSLGMSDDFEAAIAEGSTCVRIGTAVFQPPGLVDP